jgi:hypothetical protein
VRACVRARVCVQSEIHGSKPKDESPREGYTRHLMTTPLLRAQGRVRPGVFMVPAVPGGVDKDAGKVCAVNTTGPYL